jgi:hypothetical protein
MHADEQHDTAYAQRMKRWAHEEGAANRNHHGAGGGRGSGTRTGTSAGMGGVAAGAAVTGHRPRGSATVGATKGKPPAKKPINATGATTTATGAAPVRKTVSALSVVADRRGRFDA